MSTNDQALARALKKAAAEVQEMSDSPEARARTVAALQAAMKGAGAATPAPVRGSRTAWVLALAAALTLLVGAGLWFRAQPAGVASVVASSGTLKVGHTLANAEVVDTGQATMTLELRRGVVVLATLSQLRAPRYGYELRQALANRGMPIEEGTLYPLLRRLETLGLLKSEWKIEDGPPRRYYSLNADGRKLLKKLTESWQGMNKAMDRLLKDD